MKALPVLTTTAAMVLAMLLLGFASPAQAQARMGTVIELEAIENRGEDETKRVQTQRNVGRTLGRAAGYMGSFLGATKAAEADGGAGMAVAAVAPAVTGYAERAGGDLAARVGGPGETTRYMVKVRLDNRRVLSITQLRTELQGVEVGSRVAVEGRGDEARVRLAE